MMHPPEKQGVVLTGMKPTGRPHLGNYLGMIQPALAEAAGQTAYFFIADYHALTTVHDPRRMVHLVDEAAATWLAVGLDPDQVVFFRQSAVPQIMELAWVLACSTAKGWLNRAHAYKAAVEHNRDRGRDADADINAGLYSYPVLMAADILAFDADWVPVGHDQAQHVQIARDIAGAFNHAYGEVFKLPRVAPGKTVETIPGLDGRKMSKSYGNEIPILAGPEQLQRLVRRIITDSRAPEEPKVPEHCNLFAIFSRIAAPAEVASVRKQYLEGGLGYQVMKERLWRLLADHFAPARERMAALMADRAHLHRLLERGAGQARQAARQTLSRARRAVGIDAPGGVHE